MHVAVHLQCNNGRFTVRHRCHHEQEAQLSHRVRATAAWVSLGQNITGRGYSAPNIMGLSSTTVTSKALEISEITQSKGY